MIPNSIIRLKARKSLKNNMHIALLIALTVSLPSLLTQVFEIIGGNSVSTWLNDQMTAAIYAGEDISPELLIDGLQQILTHQSFPTYLFFAVNLLLGPVLTLGENYYLLKIARGEAGTYTDVFSKISCFAKALWLQILTLCKAFLWELPGLAFVVIGLFLFISSNGGMFWILLMYAGFIAGVVMGMRASLSYMLSTAALAEDTGRKAMECINISKKIMIGKKGQLLAMVLMFTVYNMIVEMLSTMLNVLLGTVFGMTISMALSLVINIYMTSSICNFYLVYSGNENAFSGTGIRQNPDGTFSSDDSTVE